MKPNRYTASELYLCCGGTFGPKRIEIDSESLTGENLKLSKWYDKLPQDGGYRFRAGSLRGKLWAEISIEFRNFCDAVEHWSFTCAAPADEAGKVIKRVDRRPEVSLYWRHLAETVADSGATMETMYEETESDLCHIVSPLPFVDLDHAMAVLEKVKKSHPRKLCTLEKYDRTSQVVVAMRGRDHGRPVRQVDVSLPIRPFADRAEIRAAINGFLRRLGWCGRPSADTREIEAGMRHTVVNVI